MLKLGVPSKGRLMEQTFDWFAARGIALSRRGSAREYAASLDGVEGMSLVLLSAGEIPRELSAGRIHLGVTGTDLVREKIPLWQDRVQPLVEMGFGHADLIIAVPDFWVDVVSVADLDEVAAEFREKHGFRLRIATKYHRLVRTYLKENAVADYQIVDSQGATEGTVANLSAEAIADITSTGATLAANHLRMLSDGPILASQATVFLARHALLSPADQAALSVFRDKIARHAPEVEPKG